MSVKESQLKTMALVVSFLLPWTERRSSVNSEGKEGCTEQRTECIGRRECWLRHGGTTPPRSLLLTGALFRADRQTTDNHAADARKRA